MYINNHLLKYKQASVIMFHQSHIFQVLDTGYPILKITFDISQFFVGKKIYIFYVIISEEYI